MIYRYNKTKQQEDAGFRLGRENTQEQITSELMVSVRAMMMAFSGYTRNKY